MTMTVRQMRECLDLCPDDAEVFVMVDELNAEIPLFGPMGFYYVEQDNVVDLRLDEEDVEDVEDEQIERPGAKSAIELDAEAIDICEVEEIRRQARKTQQIFPAVVDVSFTPVIPEEQGDPEDPNRYGAPA